MNRAWAVVGVLVALLIVLCKSVELQPPAWLYLATVLSWAFALLRWPPARTPWRGLSAFAVLAAGILALFVVPWSRREQFLNDLYSIEPGSSVTDVQHTMARYMVGSGIPALDGSGREIGVPDAVIFRHSTEPAYNCEWGIVHFREGRVTEVSLAYD